MKEEGKLLIHWMYMVMMEIKWLRTHFSKTKKGDYDHDFDIFPFVLYISTSTEVHHSMGLFALINPKLSLPKLHI